MAAGVSMRVSVLASTRGRGVWAAGEYVRQGRQGLGGIVPGHFTWCGRSWCFPWRDQAAMEAELQADLHVRRLEEDGCWEESWDCFLRDSWGKERWCVLAKRPAGSGWSLAAFRSWQLEDHGERLFSRRSLVKEKKRVMASFVCLLPWWFGE